MLDQLHVFDGRDLGRTLREHLTAWSGRTGVGLEIWALPTRDVPAARAKAVYAIIAEAVANVEAHSGARTVSVAVTSGDTALSFTVRDDGRGFAPEHRTGGRGLARMKAHAAALGGDLRVGTAPGRGTTISGVVPLR
ncbi:sensor histidine kinase [Bailinhaonella thermotolerans]|uniref:histidine kinase n=1 Tax=Bailinhaonella thermotolerans TaxID=1070861 RepID=A0A3A4B4X1_9ACTN|nr:ATP-binding protein [Bailinhaonella thermotolerans]RJL26592.1 hypothetical protein D5H75_26820 [Bailinhaonella thermotolerans]